MKKNGFLFLFFGMSLLGGCSWFQSDKPASNPSASQPSGQNPTASPPLTVPPTAPEKEQGVTGQTQGSQGQTSEAKAPSQKAIPSSGQVSPPLSAENQQVVNKIAREVDQKSGVLKQNPALTTLNRIVLAQQAEWLVSGSFGSNFKALEPELPSETEEYKFSITQGNETGAIVVAIAKSDKLPSFTAATFAVPPNLPVSVLCQTKLPSQKPPSTPKLNGDEAICGNDAVAVED